MSTSHPSSCLTEVGNSRPSGCASTIWTTRNGRCLLPSSWLLASDGGGWDSMFHLDGSAIPLHLLWFFRGILFR